MVTNNPDSFIIDSDAPYWIATLSDGSKVYQDDERYGPEDRAWYRLRQYCESNNLSIVSLALQFRSHYEFSTEVHDGAFFRRAVLGSFGLQGSSGEPKTIQYYILGTIKDGRIYTRKWQVPEIVCEEEDSREIEGNEDSIIWNISSYQNLAENQLENLTT